MDSTTIATLGLCIFSIVCISGFGIFTIYMMFKIANRKNDD